MAVADTNGGETVAHLEKLQGGLAVFVVVFAMCAKRISTSAGNELSCLVVL